MCYLVFFFFFFQKSMMTKWDVDGRPFPGHMVAKENEFDDILFAFGLF